MDEQQSDSPAPLRLLKVSATTPSHSIAGSIAGRMRKAGYAEVQAIGPKSVNQAVKALIIARKFLAAKHIDFVLTISFTTVETDIQKSSAIRFGVIRRTVQNH